MKRMNWTIERKAALSAIRGGFVALAASVGFASGMAYAEEEPEGWTGEVSASVTAQSGSVDTFAGAVDAAAERKWTNDLVGIRFTGVYGTSRDSRNSPPNEDSNDETVQDSQALFGDWKHTIHERFFWDSGAELSRDSTQDRDVRAAVDTGPGYRAWQGENPDKSHFDLSAGVGYRFEVYDGNTGPSTEAGFVGDLVKSNGDTDHFADVFAAFEYMNLLFDDKIEWTHTGKVQMPVNATDSYIITTEGILGVPLTEAWSLRAGVLYQYVNDVPEEINPSTLRATLGLGYKF